MDDIISRGNLTGKLSLLSHGYHHSNYGISIYNYYSVLLVSIVASEANTLLYSHCHFCLYIYI